jgi:phage shock protein PspC (stress-responsive transcriptional regulator)
LFDPSDDKARRVRAIIEPLAQKYDVDETAIMISYILSITPLFKMSV